jgi:hypothetical protein
VSICNRIEQAELGYWVHYTAFREDQPPHLERRRLERAELIEEVRARVGREIGRAVEVMSCYEAGYDGFWLHRQLEAHGVRNYVIDPASLQVDRRMRRAKTDRIDTERLLRSLMAYLRGEPKVWSVAYPATNNVGFGGDDWKTLYFVSRTVLGAVNVKISGVSVPAQKRS